MKKVISTLMVALMAITSVFAQETLTIDAAKKGAAISPDMYGIFFEDINFGADGGLYAELIKNRSFEFTYPFTGWVPFGKVELLNENAPFPNNPNYIRLNPAPHHAKFTGIENEGYRGIGLKKGADYRFSVWARSVDGKEQRIYVDLVDSRNDIIVRDTITIAGTEWKKYQSIIESNVTDSHAKVRIFLNSRGSVDMDHISLFPTDTWKGRENGMRKDLAQALYDLQPKVFRFPGGCIVEGTDLATRYAWKNSVGPVENRKLNENRWHYTFDYRLYPDYFQSYGLGFFEFFQLCEDFGAEPLPVISCGLACQFQNWHEGAHAPVDNLDEYIQDAIDLIEFANGATDTKWGKLRAEMGHPAPFNLKYLAVGNEQWDDLYVERLEAFVKVLREKHPEIQIIGGAGPYASGDMLKHLWPEMKRLKVDLVDEHYYMAPTWFWNNAGRYDDYDREGPKVFAGEYSAHHPNRGNNFEAALSEAAFMTGLERNADIVRLATYAPLFAHVDGWQWRPDLIWFDNLRVVRSINYYVQQLYSHNSGTHVLSTTSNGKVLKGENRQFATACYDANTNEVIVKIVNGTEQPTNYTLDIKLPKKSKIAGEATLTTLHADDMLIENTLDNPHNVVPHKTTVAIANGQTIQIPAMTFAIYRIALK